MMCLRSESGAQCAALPTRLTGVGGWPLAARRGRRQATLWRARVSCARDRRTPPARRVQPVPWHADARETEGVADSNPLTAFGTAQESVGISVAGWTISALWMLGFCAKSKRCRIASWRLTGHDVACECHAVLEDPRLA
jgi:hypothetical protein